MTAGGGCVLSVAGRRLGSFFVVAMWIVLLRPVFLVAETSPCQVMHGRAHLYGGDGQLRIWHIGTHHEYQPDGKSWPLVESWLDEGVKEPERSQYVIPASMVFLFGDFMICPTEPFRKGAVQAARVAGVTHRR